MVACFRMHIMDTKHDAQEVCFSPEVAPGNEVCIVPLLLPLQLHLVPPKRLPILRLLLTGSRAIYWLAAAAAAAASLGAAAMVRRSAPLHLATLAVAAAARHCRRRSRRLSLHLALIGFAATLTSLVLAPPVPPPLAPAVKGGLAIQPALGVVVERLWCGLGGDRQV